MCCSIFGSLFCTFVACGKRRNAIGWFLFGAFAPLVAMVAIGCLPALRAPPSEPIARPVAHDRLGRLGIRQSGRV
jgi:hypothetical protein